MRNNRILKRMNKVAANTKVLDTIKSVDSTTLIRNVVELSEWFYNNRNDKQGDTTVDEFAEFLSKNHEDVIDIIFDHIPDSINDEEVESLSDDKNQMDLITDYLIEISYHDIEKLYDLLDSEQVYDSNPGDIRDSDFI